MKNKKLKVIMTIVVVLLLIQFIRPKTDYGQKETKSTVFPHDVEAILQKSCYDCHSNNTDLKWFDQITPVNWIVADHIEKGKNVLNFSDWEEMEKPERNAKIWESVNQIILGAMPLESYTKLHPEAKLGQKDLSILKKYVLSLVPKQKLDTAKNQALEKQYEKWTTSTADIKKKLPTALNGIQYIPEYKNWIPISTTQRVDNGTIRIIYGNAVATKAIKNHQTNPWPDGTILAKVAWDQLTTPEGNITTGAFKQVEYMIKDKVKFASTEGWGWARFKTPELKPYGSNVLFATECINCHRPVANSDFVFTEPIQH